MAHARPAAPTLLAFDRPPPGLVIAARALRPLPRAGDPFAVRPLRAVWRGFLFETARVASLSALTGFARSPAADVLLPQVLTFRLQMAVLTHPAMPIGIRASLQVRNRLVLYAALPPSRPFEVETDLVGHRRLSKGLEVDLRTVLRDGAEPVWESLSTFYFRGHFRGSDDPAAASPSPVVEREPRASWRTRSDGGWRFGELTGDYNPLHWWSAYARRLGHTRPSLHPPAVVATCLPRLRPPEPVYPITLDLWFKGPIHYDTDVELHALETPGATDFAVHLVGDERPALVGVWASGQGAS